MVTQQAEILEWAVIGAGPAGIASVGHLLDQNVDASQIAWIDPHFQCGDFGLKWRNITSNTKVKHFIAFLASCQSFSYDQQAKAFSIDSLNPEHTCYLRDMAVPLKAISDRLRGKTRSYTATVECLEMHNQTWSIHCQQNCLRAKKVIVAIGATPKNLAYYPEKVIPLEQAIDPEQAERAFHEDDVVAVFGSSHSAINVMQNVLNKPVKTVYNFFRVPLRYAVDFGDWILFDNTGLKGNAAKWARAHIDGTALAQLQRLYSNEANLHKYLPQCNKLVYCVGFQRRALRAANLPDNFSYNEHMGIIAPGLFGVGIAFPNQITDKMGNIEYQVGLFKFTNYLKRVMPIWLHYPQ